MAAGTKDRIMETTAQLFQRYGYTGTGLKQIVGGGERAVRLHLPPLSERQGATGRGGDPPLRARCTRQLFEAIFDAAPDVATATGDFFLGAAETLRQTDYADACPIETVALEVASTNEPLRKATAAVFESWIAAGTERLSAAGIPEPEARRVTIVFLAALEGAFVLCRATRTTEALEVAGEQMTAIVREALE